MSKKEEQFNLEEIKKKALERFRSGKSLYGKDGAFAPMLKSFLESALKGELDSHLAFPSDMALLKLIYLAYLNIRRKWTQPLKNWCLTLSQLAIRFSGRLNLTI